MGSTKKIQNWLYDPKNGLHASPKLAWCLVIGLRETAEFIVDGFVNYKSN